MCLFPNSAETTDPNELKFCGMISLRMGGYRLKNIQVWSTVCRKSSYPKESSSRYSHFASIVMQPLVYHNVTVYMCTLLFSPSSSLLFLIFINKSYFQVSKISLHPHYNLNRIKVKWFSVEMTRVQYFLIASSWFLYLCLNT